MKRKWPQLLLMGTFIPFCWLTMQAMHELGHVAGALITGGTVAHVELNPLTISRTDLAENPNPLVVAWLGPVVGVVLPLVVLGVFTLQLQKFRSRNGERALVLRGET